MGIGPAEDGDHVDTRCSQFPRPLVFRESTWGLRASQKNSLMRLDSGNFFDDDSEQTSRIAIGCWKRSQAAWSRNGEPQMSRRVLHAPIPWTRVLMAVLCAITHLAAAATGADSSGLSCPDGSPLGGWIRMREVDQVRRPPAGCDQVVNIYMTFDLVSLAASDPTLAKLPPQLREQMLNTWPAWIAGRSATKLKYYMWSDGCHDIGGRLPCSMPAAQASGEFVFDKRTPIGFQSTVVPLWLSPNRVVFNPMNPSVQIPTFAKSGQSFLYHTSFPCGGGPLRRSTRRE